MAALWTIFSPHPETKLRELEAQYLAQVERYLADHPDCEDTWGEPTGGGPVPAADDVVREYRAHRLPLADYVLERLSACRSAFYIDRPGDLSIDRLQVSLLRYVLDRIGKGLIMFNDYPLESTDIVRLELRGHEEAVDF